jgi:hypothetical protein
LNTNNYYTKFGGNPFVSFIVIFYTLCLLSGLFWLLPELYHSATTRGYPTSVRVVIYVLIFSLATLYFILGVSSFYFLISDKEILVRNHFFPWIKKQYDVTEIRSFYIEWTRLGRGLRIVTKKYRVRVYAVLSRRQAKMLKDKLEKLNIPFISY